MDGKTGAEKLIAQLISDPSLLAALTSAAKSVEQTASEAPTEVKSEEKEG